MASVLELGYSKPTRPYSQNELTDNRTRTRRHLKLGEHFAHHSRCQHYYLARVNGRKEKDILEAGTGTDVGNCSVCWKVSRTPHELREIAYDLIQSYSETFFQEPENLTYSKVELELAFYKWLYLEWN
jgi:hypothetical protein